MGQIFADLLSVLVRLIRSIRVLSAELQGGVHANEHT